MTRSGARLKEPERPDYPLAAIREALFNAIVHRTYENTNAPVRINWFLDRVEVLSPGGLFGRVTRDNFGQVTDYRNPVIAEALNVLGYVERFGVGVARMRATAEANGNPAPEFVFEDEFVNVTIRSAR